MISEPNYIITEVSATLEQISRANQMLAYHRQFDEIDQHAVENFERLKADFIRQLASLLREFDISAELQTLS